MAVIVSSQPNRETSYVAKLAILGAVTLIFAVLAGFFLSGLLYPVRINSNGVYGVSRLGSEWLIWILAAAALLLLVAAWGIGALIIKTKIIYAIFALSVLALISPLVLRLNGFQWLGVLILFLWLVFAKRKIQGDLQLLVKPKAGRILRRGIRTILNGLIIFITVFYFFSPRLSNAENLFLPKNVFDAVLAPLEKIVQGFIPGFSKNMTVDEAILAIVGGAAFDQQVQSTPELKKLSPQKLAEAKNKFLAEYQGQILGQGKEQLSKQFGIPLQNKGNKKISDVFYELALAQLEKLPSWVKTAFAVLIALGIYSVLKIAAIPFGWLAQILSAVLLKLLLATKFVLTKKEMIERETVTL